MTSPWMPNCPLWPSGEGVTAGEPAGAGAGASRWAKEAALWAGWPWGLLGRCGRSRQLPPSAAAHSAGLVRGLAGLSQRTALPQHAEHLTNQSLLAAYIAALRPGPVIHTSQPLLAAVHQFPGLHPSSGLHPIPAIHLATYPELPKASVLPTLAIYNQQPQTKFTFYPAQNLSEWPSRNQVHLQEVQHLHQVGKPAEERCKSYCD